MRYDLAYVTGNLSNTEKGQSKFAAWLVQFVRKYIEMVDSMCKMLTCYVLFFRSCAGFFKASLSLNGASEKNCFARSPSTTKIYLIYERTI